MLSAPDWGFPRLRCAEWGNRMLASSDCTAIIVPTHQRSEDWGTANRSFHHAQRDTVSRFKISWTFCQCLIFPWLSMTSGNFQVSCRDTQTVHTSDPRRLCSSFCLKGLLCAYICVCVCIPCSLQVSTACTLTNTCAGIWQAAYMMWLMMQTDVAAGT